MKIMTLAALFAAAFWAGICGPASAAPETISANVTAIDAEHYTIGLAPLPDQKTSVTEDPFVADGSAFKQIFLASGAPGFIASTPHIELGDRITVTVDLKKSRKLSALKINGHVTTWRLRFGVLVAAFVLVIVLAMIATRANLTSFLIGADGRYSNSKTQVMLWFTTVIAAYIATIALRVVVCGGDYLGFVDIPTNLLVLSGLSALTYAGAKAITTQKVNAVVSAGGINPKSTSKPPNILSDLFLNDFGETDVGDFQMILVTLIAIVIFILSVINFLAYIELKSPVSLPDVDTTLLSAFGIGQGAYLVKKMASNPGEG